MGGAVFLDKMERVKGIEPSSFAWEAEALPLSYTRLFPVYESAHQGTSIGSRTKS